MPIISLHEEVRSRQRGAPGQNHISSHQRLAALHIPNKKDAPPSENKTSRNNCHAQFTQLFTYSNIPQLVIILLYAGSKRGIVTMPLRRCPYTILVYSKQHIWQRRQDSTLYALNYIYDDLRRVLVLPNTITLSNPAVPSTHCFWSHWPGNCEL